MGTVANCIVTVPCVYMEEDRTLFQISIYFEKLLLWNGDIYKSDCVK